jgi:hypothetical protein
MDGGEGIVCCWECHIIGVRIEFRRKMRRKRQEIEAMFLFTSQLLLSSPTLLIFWMWQNGTTCSDVAQPTQTKTN